MELIRELVAEYGSQVVIIAVGVILRWWERSKLRSYYKERIKDMEEDFKMGVKPRDW